MSVPAPAQELRLSPGMRVEIRDAEWRINQVDTPTHGGLLLTCTGQSELVRGRTARFLTELDPPKILAPETTTLVEDHSGNFEASLLYIDTALRTAPPEDGRIHIGHRAAMDQLPFQLDPALQALDRPRPRILIADAVGLGKTLEAGILVSELIRRGRGRRILVVTMKSMLMQFQREFWQRFTIPLVRLDSVGLQRVRNQIPANHNPFLFFDRAIISIDTLKQTLEYRHHLENAYWDLIVIDEIHNAAKRSSQSRRHRLAELLARRCDGLILLSATPHDGRSESFASIIDFLDPTAIPNPKDYGPEDYRGLVIRRLKKDVADQLTQRLAERQVFQHRVVVRHAAEQEALERVHDAEFPTLDRKSSRGTHQLLRTTLAKALWSSPAACHATVEERLKRLARQRDRAEELATLDAECDKLRALGALCAGIGAERFSKYQHLLAMLRPEGRDSIDWDHRDPEDRVVIFTESLRTMHFLAEHLPQDLELPDKACATLSGVMRDVELTAIINDFNSRSTPLRVLICSDVASEGLNLHHCCHRLIHFDVPWSLMVFQQRNGRVDRYGQTRTPQLHYLITASEDEEVNAELRVLEVLVDKDRQASKNLGDPSEFTGAASVEEEEAITAHAIERAAATPAAGEAAADPASILAAFLERQAASAEQPLDDLSGALPPTTIANLRERTVTPRSIYPHDIDYVEAALRWLGEHRGGLRWSRDEDLIELEAPADLQQLMKKLPAEAQPEDYRFLLTNDIGRLSEDLKLARDDDSGTFGALQYLWMQHPVVEWLTLAIQDAFGRHAAPVIRAAGRLAGNEHWFLLQGGFPNRRGQTLIRADLAVQVRDGRVGEQISVLDLVDRLQLGRQPVANPARVGDTDALARHLPAVVAAVREHLKRVRQQRLEALAPRLEKQRQALATLRDRHEAQLEVTLSESAQLESVKQARRRAALAQINSVFADYETWLRDTHEVENDPYVQVLAVISGSQP